MTFFLPCGYDDPLVAICATYSVDARTRHRTTKRAEPAVATTDAQATVETKRDPGDLSLDRNMKGICLGC